MNVNIRELTKQIISQGILKFGDFTLKSGKKSWFYLDLRLIPSYPNTFRYVIKCFKETLKEIKGYNAVAGVAVGGIPFSSVLGYELNIPSLIVRSQQKNHGLKKKVEGFIPENSNVVLVDDLITTGSSKIPAILALRNMGYLVKDMVVLIDRNQVQSGQIDQLNVKLHSFAKIEDVFNESLHLEDSVLPSDKKKLIMENL